MDIYAVPQPSIGNLGRGLHAKKTSYNKKMRTQIVVIKIKKTPLLYF